MLIRRSACEQVRPLFQAVNSHIRFSMQGRNSQITTSGSASPLGSPFVAHRMQVRLLASMLCLLCASLAVLSVRYVRRQAKEKFRENAAISETSAIAEQWSKARESLALVQRQATVYTLFARKNKSIMVGTVSGNHMVDIDLHCASCLLLGCNLGSDYMDTGGANHLVFPHLPPCAPPQGNMADWPVYGRSADVFRISGSVICRTCRCSRCSVSRRRL